MTASITTVADADSTTVAWGGTLNIGGVAVAIDAPVTLKGLAERINQTKDIGVTATVVKSGVGAWQLVLTGTGNRHRQPVFRHERAHRWHRDRIRRRERRWCLG